MAAALPCNEPAGAFEPAYRFRAGDDGKRRHVPSALHSDVDDLDVTPCGARLGFDVQPAFDRFSNVRE
jgi:hypothetical protein